MSMSRQERQELCCIHAMSAEQEDRYTVPVVRTVSVHGSLLKILK